MSPPVAAPRKVVPFDGQLKLGSRGPQVKAVQRATVRAGFGGKLKGATGFYGLGTRARVKRAERAYGLPEDGVYDLKLHAALLPDGFADYEIFLYTGRRPGETAAERQRRQIVAACLSLYSIRDRVHYTQGPSRMTIVRRRLRPPFPGEIWEDCSSIATGVYYVALAPDPNDRGYDGEGYTGTLGSHGKRVTLAEAQPGDLVLYGSGWPWVHVAVYLGGGRVWSHGSESGPLILPIDYRSDRGEIRSYL